MLLTWSRSGCFKGSYEEDGAYYAGRQVLRHLEKRNKNSLSDLLVVELDGWNTKKTKTYQEAGKHVIAAEDVYDFVLENYPEVML